MFGREKATAQLDVLPAPRPSAAAVEAAPLSESVLAPSLTVKGDIDFEGALRIEGEVRGRITGQGRLTVNRSGRVLGDIVAAQVVIQGRVQGNVLAADRLEIHEGAEVVGDLKAGSMMVAEGAKILGRLDVNSEGIVLAPPDETGKKEGESDALDKIL